MRSSSERTPALKAENRALKEESAAAGGGLQHAHLRKSLVVAQVALSTLLVAGAALFARSLANLETLGPGFDTAHVVTFAVDATLTGRTPVQAKQLYRALGRNVRYEHECPAS